MRKLILFNFMTLDGFFADSGGGIDWHTIDDEFQTFAMEQLDSVDTILFGRLTYELMAAYWPTESVISDDPIIARQMNHIPKIVFSKTLSRVDWANSRLVKENASEEVSALKKQSGGDMIIFGSADLASTLTQHGLIDEYRVMLNPVVLGNGRPLFQGVERRLRLNLLSARVFRSGNILLIYGAGGEQPHDRTTQ